MIYITILIFIFAGIGVTHTLHEVYRKIKEKLEQVKEIDNEFMDY